MKTTVKLILSSIFITLSMLVLTIERCDMLPCAETADFQEYKTYVFDNDSPDLLVELIGNRSFSCNTSLSRNITSLSQGASQYSTVATKNNTYYTFSNTPISTCSHTINAAHSSQYYLYTLRRLRI